MRQFRFLVALDLIQGDRTRVVDDAGRVRPLRDVLRDRDELLRLFRRQVQLLGVGLDFDEAEPLNDESVFAKFAEFWESLFPQFVSISGSPVSIVVIDSNATSGTIAGNAFGAVSPRQVARVTQMVEQLATEPLVFALHHHIALPPHASGAFYERGLLLLDGSFVLRALLRRPRTVAFNGHRHIGYMASAADAFRVVSAPSSTLGDARDRSRGSGFWVHTLSVDGIAVDIQETRWIPANGGTTST